MNKNISIISKLILSFLIFLISQSSLLAHGISQSFPKEVGNYVIEFEYDTLQIIAGEANSYVFRLLDKAKSAPVPFDSLLVRYERMDDESTYIVARVAQDELQEGVGRLTTQLDKGDYKITLFFYKNEAKIAETDYNLNVKPAEREKSFPSVLALWFIGGAGLGFVGARLMNMATKSVRSSKYEK